MVYVDVTSSCKSASNSGMQRMTRRIWTGLARSRDALPMFWNYVSQTYQELGQQERLFLETPFADFTAPTARPDARGETFWNELWRIASCRRIHALSRLKSADVLLVPDFFGDQRVQSLPALLRQTG